MWYNLAGKVKLFQFFLKVSSYIKILVGQKGESRKEEYNTRILAGKLVPEKFLALLKPAGLTMGVGSRWK